MSVVISDEILQASQLTPSEFCQEIALFLFQTERFDSKYVSKSSTVKLGIFSALLAKLSRRVAPTTNYNI